jgi:hypothetical protein
VACFPPAAGVVAVAAEPRACLLAECVAAVGFGDGALCVGAGLGLGVGRGLAGCAGATDGCRADDDVCQAKATVSPLDSVRVFAPCEE